MVFSDGDWALAGIVSFIVADAIWVVKGVETPGYCGNLEKY